MSIFRDTAIILHIKKRGDKEHIYTIFTYQFGKILVNKKQTAKEKAIDVGYIINCEITSGEANTIHKIRNIKIISEFNTDKYSDFPILYSYLDILASTHRNTEFGVPNPEIFDTIKSIHKIEKISETFLILAKLKIKSLSGNLEIEHENKNIKKILWFVQQNKIHTIAKLVGIEEIEKQILKNL